MLHISQSDGLPSQLLLKECWLTKGCWQHSADSIRVTKFWAIHPSIFWNCPSSSLRDFEWCISFFFAHIGAVDAWTWTHANGWSNSRESSCYILQASLCSFFSLTSSVNQVFYWINVVLTFSFIYIWANCASSFIIKKIILYLANFWILCLISNQIKVIMLKRILKWGEWVMNIWSTLADTKTA